MITKTKLFGKSYVWEVADKVNNWMDEQGDDIRVIDVKLHTGEKGSLAAVIYEEVEVTKL